MTYDNIQTQLLLKDLKKVEEQERKMQELKEKYQKQEYDEKIEVILRFYSTLYDKNAVYSNLIVAAAYVVFFIVWRNMKSYLSKIDAISAALCITFSLTVFVFWEVAKMIITSQSFSYFNKAFKASNPTLQEFDHEFAKVQSKEYRLNVNFMEFW